MKNIKLKVKYADRNNDLDVYEETISITLHAEEDLAVELSRVKARYDNSLIQRHKSNEFFVPKLISVTLVGEEMRCQKNMK